MTKAIIVRRQRRGSEKTVALFPFTGRTPIRVTPLEAELLRECGAMQGYRDAASYLAVRIAERMPAALKVSRVVSIEAWRAMRRWQA